HIVDDPSGCKIFGDHGQGEQRGKQTRSHEMLFTQKLLPAFPGVGARFAVGFRSARILASAHESMSRTRVSNRFKNLARGFHCGYSVWNGGADTRVIFGVEAINRSLDSRHVVLLWRSAVKDKSRRQIRPICG